jgi:hypothetical protein
LALTIGNEYASLKVNAGMASFLVQHPKNSHLFCFVPAEKWKQMSNPQSNIQESKYDFHEVCLSEKNGKGECRGVERKTGVGKGMEDRIK